jgi:hypothetical protein
MVADGCCLPDEIFALQEGKEEDYYTARTYPILTLDSQISQAGRQAISDICL